MLVKTYLCLAAASLSAYAVNVPAFAQFAVDSGLALTGLNSIALLNSLGNFKGTCNPANLKVRQEWYVSLRQHGVPARTRLLTDLQANPFRGSAQELHCCGEVSSGQAQYLPGWRVIRGQVCL